MEREYSIIVFTFSGKQELSGPDVLQIFAHLRRALLDFVRKTSARGTCIRTFFRKRQCPVFQELERAPLLERQTVTECKHSVNFRLCRFQIAGPLIAVRSAGCVNLIEHARPKTLSQVFRARVHHQPPVCWTVTLLAEIVIAPPLMLTLR